MFHIAELTDQVIDHLHADAATLRNCALVARSWLPASQLHIFFSVNIKHDATCRLLCAILARSPHIAGYIRNIYIYFEVTNPSFTSLLDLRIPQPRRLSIVNCPNTGELGLLQHLIGLPSLTDIRFFSGTSVSRAQLDYLTRIRTTKLAHLLLYSASDTPAPQDKELEWATAEPLSVSALNVSGDATLVTSTLAAPHGPIDLQNVEALTFDTNDIGCLQRLLTVCGAELVVLEILVSSPTLASHVHIGNSTIPYLIDLLLYDITTTTLPAVLALLSQLDPATSPLRTLRLAAAEATASSPFLPSAANRAVWRAVDAVLGALGALVSVEVEPDVRVDADEFFPTLGQRRLLTVHPPKPRVETPPPSPPVSDTA
ncbi:hypothetical protein C8R46DRAFT_655482 [Mycena filopes]|nr:hypothetical protein C8R46DRAFT_655482 [Mycena filopes]